MEACFTPMERQCKLVKPEKANEKVMAMYPYQILIAALMFLAVTTLSDKASGVNYMSQFNANYNEEHWKAAKRILRYLNGTKSPSLTYTKNAKQLYGVSDAEWDANLTDRRSYSGYAFLSAGAAISWKSRKQRNVALFSTAAEYMVISESTKKAMPLYNNSQNAHKLIQCMGYSSHTEHIVIHHHFVRECLQRGAISLNYMPTENMPANAE